MDESINGVDESMNLDKDSDSDEGYNRNDVLGMMQEPIADNKIDSRHSLGAFTKIPKGASDLAPSMNSSQEKKARDEQDAKDQNPFKPKKQGFTSTLSKAFKNLF